MGHRSGWPIFRSLWQTSFLAKFAHSVAQDHLYMSQELMCGGRDWPLIEPCRYTWDCSLLVRPSDDVELADLSGFDLVLDNKLGQGGDRIAQQQ